MLQTLRWEKQFWSVLVWLWVVGNIQVGIEDPKLSQPEECKD